MGARGVLAPFAVTMDAGDDGTVLTASGELDAVAAPLLQDAVAAVAGEVGTDGHVLVDLSG